MEFKITKDPKGKFKVTFKIDTRTVTEDVPAEALLDRDELFKYCNRRAYALGDKIKRERPSTYPEIDDDINKDYPVTPAGTAPAPVNLRNPNS